MEPMFSFSHGNELVEASIHFAVSDVEEIVGRIASVIPQGFGDDEIAEVVGLVKSLKLEHVGELAFAIEDDEDTYELRVRASQDGDDASDLAFLSAPTVASAIADELERFHAEQDA
jgi:hypothetical protein